MKDGIDFASQAGNAWTFFSYLWKKNFTTFLQHFGSCDFVRIIPKYSKSKNQTRLTIALMATIVD